MPFPFSTQRNYRLLDSSRMHVLIWLLLVGSYGFLLHLRELGSLENGASPPRYLDQQATMNVERLGQRLIDNCHHGSRVPAHVSMISMSSYSFDINRS